MDLIEKIGPFVGLVAFIGLAVLAFVMFQQSRDIRRLREWAGRAPERAREAAGATAAAAEARGEAGGEERMGRLAVLWERAKAAVVPPARSVDRRLPVDGRIVAGILALGAVVAIVLTGGFGLLGDDGDGPREKGTAAQGQDLPKVAVLNATQTPSGVAGVPGLADRVAQEVVRQAGYPLGERSNAPSGFEESVVMYAPDSEGDAAQLSRAVEGKLGETNTQELATDIQGEIGDAKLVLVVGADDAGFE